MADGILKIVLFSNEKNLIVFCVQFVEENFFSDFLIECVDSRAGLSFGEARGYRMIRGPFDDKHK